MIVHPARKEKKKGSNLHYYTTMVKTNAIKNKNKKNTGTVQLGTMIHVIFNKVSKNINHTLEYLNGKVPILKSN